MDSKINHLPSVCDVSKDNQDFLMKIGWQKTEKQIKS